VLLPLLAFAIVKVPAPKLTLPFVPVTAPVKEAIALFEPFKFKLAEAIFARLTALLGERALTAPAFKMPELIVVVPE